MRVVLKRKYLDINEQPEWKNKAKKRSMKQFGSGREGQGSHRVKGKIHPLGFSGRTIGAMVRRATNEK